MKRIMQPTEAHYLNCTDTDCENYACVARRDYENRLSRTEDSLGALKTLVTNITECPRCATCKASAEAILKLT